ncbi:hypothetical protein [Treponema sp. UBA3813]|nr:hypothetical protein [Treponema sp. UBA3813]
MKKILAASLCALLSMGLLLSCNEKGEKKVNHRGDFHSSDSEPLPSDGL